MKQYAFALIAGLTMSLWIAGCGTVGKAFDSAHVEHLQKGKTTKAQVLEMFGLPFKEGSQDGSTTWTYQHDNYFALGRGDYKDLVIMFDGADVVKSYRYTSTGN